MTANPYIEQPSEYTTLFPGSVIAAPVATSIAGGHTLTDVPVTFSEAARGDGFVYKVLPELPDPDAGIAEITAKRQSDSSAVAVVGYDTTPSGSQVSVALLNSTVKAPASFAGTTVLFSYKGQGTPYSMYEHARLYKEMRAGLTELKTLLGAAAASGTNLNVVGNVTAGGVLSAARHPGAGRFALYLYAPASLVLTAGMVGPYLGIGNPTGKPSLDMYKPARVVSVCYGFDYNLTASGILRIEIRRNFGLSRIYDTFTLSGSGYSSFQQTLTAWDYAIGDNLSLRISSQSGLAGTITNYTATIFLEDVA